MILIICHKNDKSTDEIINWLHFFNQKFFRCDFKGFIQNFILKSVVPNNGVQSSQIFSKRDNCEVKSIWYRREDLENFDFNFREGDEYFKNLLLEEYIAVKKVFWNSTNSIKCLSSFDSSAKDKIKMLNEANLLEIDIPETIITNNKNDLHQFLEKNSELICKASSENINYVIDNEIACAQYVKSISKIELETFPEYFFPTFFQKKIDKEFDIRVFFLNNICYSMAIFSNKTDFREDYKQHRYVSIKLPDSLEEKIVKLMNKLNLNIGCLDFVKSRVDLKYYFLEINPNGFFSMVSIPCNYYLEKKIAEYLIYE